MIEKFEMSKFHPEVPTAYEQECKSGSPIVPNTFGEELSYYETLKKMSDKLNSIIDALNSGATLNVETTTTSTEADHSTKADTAVSSNYANKASVAKCAERAGIADFAELAENAKHADRATNVDNARHALLADNATNANTASTATYASTAGNATYATDADEADFATNAGRLGGHLPSYFMRADASVMENPMSASQDIIVGGISGTPTRLGKGTDGQVLKIVSGNVAWADESGGGSEPSTYLKSASYLGNTLTLVNKDNSTVVFTPVAVFGGTTNEQEISNTTTIVNSNDITVYLKSASVNGNTLTLTKQDDTTVVFTPTAKFA